jgi:hypothetical protein
LTEGVPGNIVLANRTFRYFVPRARGITTTAD